MNSKKVDGGGWKEIVTGLYWFWFYDFSCLLPKTVKSRFWPFLVWSGGYWDLSLLPSDWAYISMIYISTFFSLYKSHIDYCSDFNFKLGYVCLLELRYLFDAECQIPCKLHNRGWNHYQEEQGKKEANTKGMMPASFWNSLSF